MIVKARVNAKIRLDVNICGDDITVSRRDDESYEGESRLPIRLLVREYIRTNTPRKRDDRDLIRRCLQEGISETVKVWSKALQELEQHEARLSLMLKRAEETDETSKVDE